MEAAAGSYTLTVSGGRPTGSGLKLPDAFGFTGAGIDLTANRTQDLTVPADTVDVTAVSPFGTTLANVVITLTAVPGAVELFPGGESTATAFGSATTADSGVASLYAITGLAYSTKATPPAGSGYQVTNSGPSPVVTGPTGWTIELARDLKRFTGTVTDVNGAAVVGATVRLDGNEADQHYAITTSGSGAFTLDAAPNSAYLLRVSGTKAASPDAYLPDTFTLSATVDVTADTTRDIEVSVVRLGILTRDDRLTPVDGVGIAFTSAGSQNGLTAASTTIRRDTANGGRAELVMLTGTTYTIVATPPAGIGYVTTGPQVGAPQFTVNPKRIGESTVVSSTASDAGSGVAAGEYFLGAIDPGQGSAIPMTLDAGAVKAVIGTGLAAGTYQVNVRARDGLGTWSAPALATLTVSLPAAPASLQAVSPTNFDPVRTAPTIAAVVTPAPNTAGWNNSPVIVTFACADPGGSGVAFCTGPASVNAETAGQDVLGIVTDQAGNTRTVPEPSP